MRSLSSVFRLCALAMFAWGLGCQAPPEPPPETSSAEPLTYVGRESCSGCHEQELDTWSGSHHDLAMEEATEATVLGDFGDARFTYGAVTSRFFRRGGRYFVNTDGPDGALQDFEIRYAFGVEPLQQYLIEFPDGRIQALGIVWDARDVDEGGQRWYHLYPDEIIDHEDPLHWTDRFQNWNFMCAECHSTNVRKNFSAEDNTFATSFSEIDVSCESCHGPGSNHVAWANGGKEHEDAAKGLVASLKDVNPGVWNIDSETGLAKRSPPRESRVEIETCARCHARRSVLTEDYVHGRPLANSHRPALLDDALYHADGQILDEVYVYGSFLQSKMYREGVSCKDCHEPHSLELKGGGNALCAGCHSASKFDDPSHHFHPAGSPGAQCVSCHMPERVYMGVDGRRDHSFRVPRPDLTERIGTPNACNGCHSDRESDWAVAAVSGWFPEGRTGTRHYGDAIHAMRARSTQAVPLLKELIDDPDTPGIVRASALRELPAFVGAESLGSIRSGLSDPDPLVRMGAVLAGGVFGADQRPSLLSPLLSDPVRSVRLSAARLLAEVSSAQLTPAEQQKLTAAIEEYRAAQELVLDRPEGHLNLGVLAAHRGDLDGAEASYRSALSIDDSIAEPYINIADLYRLRSRDLDGERILREGLSRVDNEGELRHALGLLLVRLQRTPEAVEELRLAAEARPELPRYAYVYAVALNGTGEVDEAIQTLENAHESYPADAEILFGLVTFLRDAGRVGEAITFASDLVTLRPGDPGPRQLLTQLQSMR